MKTYVIVTGSIFGLLVLVHVWRAVEEGMHVARDPWFIGITVLAGALCAWAVRLIGGSRAT